MLGVQAFKGSADSHVVAKVEHRKRRSEFIGCCNCPVRSYRVKNTNDDRYNIQYEVILNATITASKWKIIIYDQAYLSTDGPSVTFVRNVRR
jgi:hypothetical protein